jgi:hypothetical protein
VLQDLQIEQAAGDRKQKHNGKDRRDDAANDE